MHRQLLIGATAASAAFAQEPQARELPPPLWTAAEGLSSIGALRELPDGRVMIIDRRENRVVVFATDGKSMSDVGRIGAGPGEYRSPVALIALPSDSTALLDQGLRRILILGPDAKPVSTMLFPEAIGPRLNLIRAADSRGRFLLQYSSVSKRTDGASEMQPLVAWDRVTNRVDTLASLRVSSSLTTSTTRADGTISGTSTYNVRYSPADDWALLSTGRVAILHGEPYSVDIIGGGGATIRGPRIPYARVDVAASERVPATVADLIPAHKPAFWDGPAIPGSDGDVWVSRSMPAGAPTRRYDRIDRAANRTFALTMDKSIRIVGFGRSAMYTVRTDADGLQWLEKRALPR